MVLEQIHKIRLNMKKLSLFAVLSYCFFFFSPLCAKEVPSPEFIVFVHSYNDAPICIKNFESLVHQTYKYVYIYYFDDGSTDNTYDLIKNYVLEHHLAHKCKVERVDTHGGFLQSLVHFFQHNKIPPNRIIALMDGADHFNDSSVFTQLSNVYAKDSIWLTYGNYKTEPFTSSSFCHDYPASVKKSCSFRSYMWLGAPLRTFYAKLFQLIKPEDFRYKGTIFPNAGEMALLFPMFEMASNGHIYFESLPFYVINTANPFSEIKSNRSSFKTYERYIRSLPPYLPLEAPLFPPPVS